MFSIDLSRVNGDTTNMLLSNISEQLSELIMILKPQEAKKEFKNEVVETKLFTCSCGKSFEFEKQLRGHKIKCKG